MIHKDEWQKLSIGERVSYLTDNIQDALNNQYYERCIYYDKDEFHKMLYECFGLTEDDMKHSVEIELFDDNLGEYVAIVCKRERKSRRAQ